MKFKGMDTLSKHVPELNSTGGKVRIALYAIFLFALVTVYFIVTDQIPTWSIDSQIIIIALGFIVMSLFFSRKQTYKEKYKELAYRNAFAHYVMPGLALIIAAIAHAGYMNGPFVPQGWWTIIFFALGWLMLCVGAILWIRSVFEFGADNLALLYVYYPEEGQIINSSIYEHFASSSLRGGLTRWYRACLAERQCKRHRICHPHAARIHRLDSSRGRKRIN